MEIYIKGILILVATLMVFSTAAGLEEQVDNVTIRMEWETNEYELETSENGYSYVVFEQEQSVAGIVNFGNFLDLDYILGGNIVEASMTQELTQETDTGEFLLPFTSGDISNIEHREENIGGGYQDDPDLFDYSNPGFSGALIESKLIRAILRYEEDINLLGDRSIQRSTNLDIVNVGREDGKTKIEIRD